jgi:predicted nuclease of predicted toxin-antitoxin system
VKLLFDENLSPRLVPALADVFPGSAHVQGVGLGSGSDEAVWLFAREQGFMLVSKDADFFELSLLRDAPPKIVWIRRGNCSTAQIEALLRSNAERIEAMASDPKTTCLVLI